MLPQEIKNRIYYFVCGGQMVHILQNDCNHNHVHGDDTTKLSHAICIERIPEEQVQKEFDSANPDTVNWTVAAVEDRHSNCHKPPRKLKRGCPQPGQLSLTLLRSCRQIYMEANMVHYAHNTFAINCNHILERFVRARFRNTQNLAIRSLYIDICVTHSSSVDAWSDSINKAVLKRLKSVRRLHLNLEQLYCTCSVDVCSYEGSEMTERQGKMFKMFCKLPLKEATLVVDDSRFLRPLNNSSTRATYTRLEQMYRWTMKQKQKFSREVRDALLERGGKENRGKQMGKAGL